MPDVSRNADLKRNFCDRGNGILIAILLIAWCALALGLGSELPVIPKNGRIVIVENPTATDAFQARPEIVRFMVARGIERIAQKTNAAEAWRKFVSPQDVVGLKVYCAPGKNAGT